MKRHTLKKTAAAVAFALTATIGFALTVPAATDTTSSTSLSTADSKELWQQSAITRRKATKSRA